MADGNPISISHLLEHTGWMRALARSLIADEDLADDLVQESLVVAMQRPPRHAGALGAWLHRVVSRLASRTRRQRAARTRREQATARPERLDAPPEGVVERVETQAQLVELVLALDEPYRSAVLWRYFESWETAAIARRQGVDESTVRWRLRQALRSLRRGLDRVHGGRAAWCAALALAAGGSAEAAASSAPGTAASVAGASGIILGGGLVKLKTMALAALLSLLIGLGVWAPLAHRRPAPPPGAAPAPAVAAVPAGAPSNTETAAPPPPAALETQPASPPPQPAAFPAAIAGAVVDRDTGEPLPGAVISVRGGKARAVAGEDGSYRLEGTEIAPTSEPYLVASAAEHAEEHARVRVEAEGTYTHDFQLEPAISLAVTVIDKEGAPLPDVQVTAAQPNGSYVHDEVYSRRTDSEGKAMLAGIGRERRPQVNARKDGFQEVWTRDYEPEPGAPVADLVIVMDRRLEGDAIVTGRVTGPGGTPLAGIHVQWIHSHGESKGRVVTETARDGTYTLVFPREQDWCAVSAFGDGYAPSVREGVRPGNAGAPAQVDFSLAPGHWLEGEVVDEEGRSVEGAVVRAMPTIYLLRNKSVHPGNVRESRTDARGRFALDDLSGPATALRIKGPEGAAWANNYHPAVEVDRKVTLKLLRWGVIRGRVIDRESREPVTVFSIKLKKGAGFYDYHRADPGEVFNAPDGRFELKELDQGGIELLVGAEGYIPKWVTDRTAEPEERAAAHDVEITRGRHIEGSVVDAEGGAPIAGATVTFGAWPAGDLAWDEGALARMVDRQEVVTEADGRFRVLEGEPGTFFVRKSGHARVVLPPGEWRALHDAAGHLTVALDPGSRLSGTLHQDGKPSKAGILALFRRGAGPDAGRREWLGGLERDASGRFHIEELQPGEYLLEHWRETPGKRTAGLCIQRPVRLERGAEQVVEFGGDLGALELRGRLTGRAGKPYEHVRLTLRPAFALPYTEFAATVTAEHDGRFHFLGLLPGKYSVEATDRNGRKTALAPLEIEADLERDLTAELDES